jgi:uncharacterized protein (TIGR04141 family)
VGVTFDVPIQVEGLVDRAREVLRLSRGSGYKEFFPFVDHVQPVDQEIAGQLDSHLAEAMEAVAGGMESGFRLNYLAPPEVIDLEAAEGFLYSSEWAHPRQFTQN